MTLQEIMQAIRELSEDELNALNDFVRQQRNKSHSPMSEAELMREIDAIMAAAEPVELVAGTMDSKRLADAMASIRESLTSEELDAIVLAMNEEYIEPDDTPNG